MASRWKPPGRKREPLGRKLGRIDRTAMACRPAASQDVAITQTADGWSFDSDDLGSGVGSATSLAVINVDVTARTGTSSPFTMGEGSALLCSLSFSGGHLIATTVGDPLTVYNSTLSTIAAGKLVQLKSIGGEWFVDVADC